ncbi:MAG: DUF3084 domain-containing protein [candidate division WS1 bacterium]|jgi:predicted  nucleic acid-binding Zn-ribbon protein|nr:DUF3084 domain-containing protein [candidate division WS1 bacterium]
MPTYTIIVFVALALLGALIAWLGDVIGARLGKRRSSIFGLRPRQSARLIAAIIGGVLPLLGLGVAMVGSRYARLAVLELGDLLRQREELQSRITELQEDAREFEQRAQSAEERAVEAEQTAEELQQVTSEQRDQISGLEARTGELQARAGELSQRVESLTSRREQLEANLGAARAGLREAEENLRTSEASLTASEEELEARRGEVAAKQRQVQTIELELNRVRSELPSVQRELTSTRQELESKVAELERRELALGEIEARLERVTQRQELISQRPALFEPGDELIRVVISSDDTQDQMVSQLYEILHLASAAARRKGVPEGSNGRAVIAVAPIPNWTPATAREIPETWVVQHVATELRTGGAAEWVLRVRAFRRQFPGDEMQLAVDFEARPNELEFRQGEVLDEFVLRADTDELRLIQGLWHRIADDDSVVRNRAIAEGMLPRPNSSSYGATDLAEIYAAVQAVQAGSGNMLVQLKSAADTYTRGPLLLNIEVKPAERPS